MKTNIRWMIRRDLNEVVEIEKSSFKFPWGIENFTSQLKKRNIIGMVSTDAQTDEILGYMVYGLYSDHLHLISFAVKEKYRRLRIGTEMIEKLIRKLNPKRRTSIRSHVRVDNFEALKFCREAGFRITSYEESYFKEYDIDAYAIRCSIREPEWMPINRISGSRHEVL
jgi:ribosomal-protein-alanine N-acetyltransferase